MYKNPLNNGDLSDYNFLKTQMDNGKRIKKYGKIKAQAKIEPTETQKYYQYLTYQQPILDELNYVAERMKTENINKQKEDFEFIENLKEDREKKLKELSKKENDLTSELRNQLFDTPLINTDTTPTINTDMEMMMVNEVNKDLENIFRKDTAVKKIQGAVKGKLAKNAKAKEIAKVEPKNEIDKAFEEARNEIQKDTDAIKKLQAVVRRKNTKTEQKRNEIDKAFEEARNEIEKDTDAIKKLQAVVRRKEIQPLYELGKKVNAETKEQIEEKAAIIIEKAILGKVKRERGKKIQKGLEEKLAEVNKSNQNRSSESRLIDALKKKQQNNEFFELTKGEPELSRRGRPRGSIRKISDKK